MYKVMKVLVDNDYDGYLHLDHTPELTGNPYTYAAYAAGFMRACIRRAQNEPRARTRKAATKRHTQSPEAHKRFRGFFLACLGRFALGRALL